MMMMATGKATGKAAGCYRLLLSFTVKILIELRYKTHISPSMTVFFVMILYGLSDIPYTLYLIK
ncbi:hypothetical protein MBAV_000392 [Candidatus Magnetobacterium bavaricum]|uniref:Uncharacterized protein n=1 Tax=Candidatus Magnetobacterium bavaricum TaxID=29290 RepID=A0A0F3GZV5_9BACT|nr:hypothetical protein MBAV_000392 [Candidatus Magnetobacterium bavaricum]